MSNIKELLRKMVQEVLADTETAPAKPTTKPTVAPGKPGEKQKPRRPLGNPDVKPNPKAMNEEEVLNKIVARFKAKKLNELDGKYNELKRKYDNITKNDKDSKKDDSPDSDDSNDSKKQKK